MEKSEVGLPPKSVTEVEDDPMNGDQQEVPKSPLNKIPPAEIEEEVHEIPAKQEPKD